MRNGLCVAPVNATTLSASGHRVAQAGRGLRRYPLAEIPCLVAAHHQSRPGPVPQTLMEDVPTLVPLIASLQSSKA